MVINMTSPTEDIKNLLLKRKTEELSDTVSNVSSGQPVKACCARLARIFDDYLARHTIKPDSTGAFSFAILKSDLVKYAGSLPNTHFRKILKLFGYSLLFRGKWVSVTKHYT